MNPALLVLHPRRIPQVLAALEQLRIPQLQLIAMSEARIAERWDDVLETATQHAFTHLIAVSDDAVVTPRALKAITDNLSDDRVVTGWCNLDETMTRVNLSDALLTSPTPSAEAYALPTVWDVLEGEERRRTFFTGMCLTAMSTAMWRRYPFGVYGPELGGFASDYHLSYRLGQDAVPIAALKGAFVRHLKAEWSQADRTPGRELLVGKVPERIVVL